MDTFQAGLIAVGVFALLVIFIAGRFRDRIKAAIKGPRGTELSIEAANPQTPGVRMQDVRSREGTIVAADRTGRGADVKDLDARGNVRVTSEPHPKALPPV